MIYKIWEYSMIYKIWEFSMISKILRNLFVKSAPRLLLLSYLWKNVH